MAMMRICVFVGSVREGRMGDRVLRFVRNQLDANKKCKVDVIDPAILDLPLLKKPMHFYQHASEVPKKLQQLNAIVESADAYLILSPEYNRCVPPALLNTMDHIPPKSYRCKPSGMVLYSMGPQGGALAGVALRPFLSELGCLPVSHFVTIGKVNEQLDEQGNTENKHIHSSFSKLMNQVEWFGEAMKNHRKDNAPKDDF
ncbi:NADPH azoreductase-like isoform X2 [Lineus longissimus]|uniref:NADPH azoreductase-like isoform X2 n=1 Tax=Lineus longissimus TaxID=88925 RepID=UPI002B4D9481